MKEASSSLAELVYPARQGLLASGTVACIVDGTIIVAGSSSLASDTLLLYRVWMLRCAAD